MNENYYGGYGYNYAPQPVQQMPWTQGLTDEEAAFLKKHAPEFSLEITKEEMLKSYCTHKDVKTRRSTLVQNPDGTYTCTTCGETFNIVQLSPEEVESHINGTKDILQTIKFCNVGMSPEAIRAYNQFLPLLDKAPKLYEIAMREFAKVNPGGNIMPAYSNNAFAMLGNAVGGMGMGFVPQPGYAQPMYQQPQPVQQQAGGFNPFMQQYQPMYTQPMYQQPQYVQPGQVMPQQGFMNQPQQVQAPVAPQPPVADAANANAQNNGQNVTVTKAFDV